MVFDPSRVLCRQRLFRVGNFRLGRCPSGRDDRLLGHLHRKWPVRNRHRYRDDERAGDLPQQEVQVTADPSPHNHHKVGRNAKARPKGRAFARRSRSLFSSTCDGAGSSRVRQAHPLAERGRSARGRRSAGRRCNRAGPHRRRRQRRSRFRRWECSAHE